MKVYVEMVVNGEEEAETLAKVFGGDFRKYSTKGYLVQFSTDDVKAPVRAFEKREEVRQITMLKVR